jgi:hypothetical protein
VFIQRRVVSCRHADGNTKHDTRAPKTRQKKDQFARRQKQAAYLTNKTHTRRQKQVAYLTNKTHPRRQKQVAYLTNKTHTRRQKQVAYLTNKTHTRRQKQVAYLTNKTHTRLTAASKCRHDTDIKNLCWKVLWKIYKTGTLPSLYRHHKNSCKKSYTLWKYQWRPSQIAKTTGQRVSFHTILMRNIFCNSKMVKCTNGYYSRKQNPVTETHVIRSAVYISRN